MIKIDEGLLAEIGLSDLAPKEVKLFLEHVYETLEMRVGMKLADRMSNEQLDEFEAYFDAEDDDGAFMWLEANFPDYKELVNQEFLDLKSEIALVAPQILAASAHERPPPDGGA